MARRHVTTSAGTRHSEQLSNRKHIVLEDQVSIDSGGQNRILFSQNVRNSTFVRRKYRHSPSTYGNKKLFTSFPMQAKYALKTNTSGSVEVASTTPVCEM